jgi:PBP1b-binding outer membrane lipoprotein LpoB
MKSIIAVFLAVLFLTGCGVVTRPTPIMSDTIKPNEKCNN